MIVVQKYGGTSLGDVHRIQRVADRVAATQRRGARVVVVVSAMGSTTDELMAMAERIAPDPPGRELDMLLTAGERIAMALLAIALHERGVAAKSFTGSQAGILTDAAHGRAKIIEVTPARLRDALADGNVVIVAGFQGVSPDTRDVTTLGRGGSDTTAVALAASLEAEVCEIYTDVDGVYTADPRIVDDARKLEHVSFEEMLELAAQGARVLQVRSVEVARNHGVPLHVRSSFSLQPGTRIGPEKEEAVEAAIISGVTHDTSESKVTVQHVPDKPGVAARIFTAMAEAGVNVDMIVQNVSEAGETDISFTVPDGDTRRATEVLVGLVETIGARGHSVDADIGKVSLVGAGMKTHPGIAARMFAALAEAGVNIEMISTSTIRLSVVVRRGDVETAVRAIHEVFELAGDAAS